MSHRNFDRLQRFSGFLGLLVLCTQVERANAQIQNITSQNDTLDWNPPARFVKDYPYYLTGYDVYGNPVWIVPFGLWDVKAIVNEGGPALDDFEKYVIQMVQRFHNPEIYGRNGSENFVIITNLDGYSYSQEFSYSTISEIMRLTQILTAVDHLGRKIKVDYFVNANFFFDAILRMVKPLLGDLFNFAEVYGTDPDTWKHILMKEIPRDQLPASLGGKYCHQYVQTFG